MRREIDMDITLEQAAAERAKGMPAPASRPSKRSAVGHSGRGGTTGVSALIEVERASAPFSAELRGFTGYACVTDTPYDMYDTYGPYQEIVTEGAIKEALAQTQLDVPLVLGHDPMRRLARTTDGTLALSLDKRGLLCNARLDPEDPDVAYILPKLQSGLIDEMSFRFMIVAGAWSEDWSQYVIERLDIHRGDVSIVAYGANPYTSGIQVAPPAQAPVEPLAPEVPVVPEQPVLARSLLTSDDHDRRSPILDLLRTSGR